MLHKQLGASEPEVIQDGGLLAPWANIVVIK
jgi:hypothetical protein